MLSLGFQYAAVNRYQRAAELNASALRILEDLNQITPARIVDVLEGLVLLYGYLGRDKDQSVVLHRLHEVYERNKESQDLIVRGQGLRVLTRAHKQRREFAAAIKFSRANLKIAESLKHFSIPSQKLQLIKLLSDAGFDGEAIDLGEKLIVVDEQPNERESLRAGGIHAAMVANTYLRAGRSEQAVSFLRRKSESIQMAHSLVWADALRIDQQYAESAERYHAISLNAPPENRQRAIRPTNSLAQMLLAIGQRDQALMAYERLSSLLDPEIEEWTQTIPAEPIVRVTENQVTYTYPARRRYPPMVLHPLDDLSDAMARLGQTETAKESLLKLLAIQNATPEMDPSGVATTYARLDVLGSNVDTDYDQGTDAATYHRALAYFNLGDQPNYQRELNDLVRRSESNEEPELLFYLINATAISSSAVDPKVMVLRDRLLASSTRLRHRLAAGAVLARAGRFEEAAREIEEVHQDWLSFERKPADCPLWLIRGWLATIYRQLDRSEMANTMLRSSLARFDVDQYLSTDRTLPRWDDMLTFRLLASAALAASLP